MIRLTIRRMAAAIAAAVGLAGSAKADITIDTFSDLSVTIYQISALNASPFSPGAVALPNGLTRNLTVTVASPAVPEFNAVSGSIGAGSFSVDTNNNSVAFAHLNYTGFGLGTSDFSGGDSIRLDFVNLNPGNTMIGVAPDMPVSVSISTGTGTLSQTVSVAGSGAPFSLFLPFAGFSGTGDLANVTGLDVTLNSGGPGGRIASDFVLNNVSTNVIPAPPAFALLLAAAPILALRRRWSAKSPA